MNRSDLTTKQIEALEKISAAGEAGLPRKENGRVTVNGNCIHALDVLGLIQSERAPYRLTDMGKVALTGLDFDPARHVAYCLPHDSHEFLVAPTFDYEAGRVEWEVACSAHREKYRGITGLTYGSLREDRFRKAFPGVAVRGED